MVGDGIVEKRVGRGHHPLFQPDTVLPSQFNAARKRGLLGEQLLMLAVLEDAVDTFFKYKGARDPRGRALCSDALDWIENRDRRWLFSFENICDSLDLNADYIRAGIRRLRTVVQLPRREQHRATGIAEASPTEGRFKSPLYGLSTGG